MTGAELAGPPAAAAGETPRPGWARAVGWLFWVYLFLLLAYVHFGFDGLYERDGYYHARYAQMLPSRGLTREFPWTQESLWKDRYFDKEFLFHVLLVPFSWNEREPVQGAKVCALLLGLAICVAFHRLLRAHGARWPLFFTALLLGASGQFLLRLTMIRSHLLSLVLLLLGLHLLFRKNVKGLFVLGLVYAWSYTFPFVLLMTAVPFAVGRWMGGGGLDWKSPLAAGTGSFLGLLVHPYAPEILNNFLTTADIVRSSWEGKQVELELGAEIYPYTTRAFLLLCPLLAGGWLALGVAGWRAQRKMRVVAGVAAALWVLMLLANDPMSTREFLVRHAWLHALLLALCALGWRHGRRLAPESRGVLFAALSWFVASMVFSRFLEYGVPLMVLALALATRDVLADTPPLGRERFAGLPARKLGLGLAWLLAAGLHGFAAWHLLGSTALADPPRFRAAAAWMMENLEPGETVAHLWWDDFPELYYDGYRQHYLLGLDPKFMARRGPGALEKLKLLEDMRRRRIPLDGARLSRTFQARFMLVQSARVKKYPELSSGSWKAVYRDPRAAIFALTGPQGPPVTPVPAGTDAEGEEY